MKKLTYLIILFLLSSGSLLAQVKDTTYSNKDPKLIPASYKDGEKGAHQFVVKNMTYPLEALQRNIQGELVVDFTVNTEGKITDVSTKSDIHYLLKEEAFRAVKLMRRWTPATLDGVPVKTRHSIPLRFYFK